MNNSKLISILRTFSKNEMKEFEKFVSSPFFNGGRNYLPFLNQLKKFYPEFDDEKMTQEYVYSQLYPGKEYNKQIVWNMTSSMLNIAEEFLIHVSLRKDKFIRNHHIASEFLERELTAFYCKKLNEMESALEQMGIDEDYFRYKTLLETGRISYYIMEDSQNMVAEHILKKGEYTILNFLRNLADVVGSLKTVYNTYNKEFRMNLPFEFIRSLQLEKVIQYSKENNFELSPLLEMYYCSIMLVMDFENTEYFFRLKKLFEFNYILFSRSESYTWAGELTNYCINKINAGDQSFRKIAFEIDKFKLKEDLVYDGKLIPKYLFIQIFANALVTDEIEWAKTFIEDYIPKLHHTHQSSMRALAYASLYYRLKDFEKVIDILGKANFRDAIDKLYVKFFYIRIYYDLNEYEILLNSIDTAKHFLSKSSSIGAHIIDNHVRFFSCFNKLLRLREKYDEFEIQKIREIIDADKSMAHREWLLEKLTELEDK